MNCDKIQSDMFTVSNNNKSYYPLLMTRMLDIFTESQKQNGRNTND